MPQSPDSSRRLAGRRILITRPGSGSDRLAKMLQRAGALVVSHPVIKTEDPVDWQAVDEAIANLDSFGWIVFVSTNGIRQFFKRFDHFEHEVQRIESRFVAIGPSTADLLVQLGIQTVVTPGKSDSDGLVQCLLENVQDERILVLRADRGSPVLAQRLSEHGKRFHEVVAYRSVDLEVADPDVFKSLNQGEFDWVTITSSAIARSANRLFGAGLQSTKLVSISPTTTDELQSLGLTPAAEAKHYNMRGVFEAILKYEFLDSRSN